MVGQLFLNNKTKRVLVVAPLSILGVWEEEFSKFAAFDYDLVILSGTGERKANALRNLAATDKLQIVVVNYESAWRLEAEILTWKPDVIICDEGHKIKVHKTKASKALTKIGATAQYRLLLTGTLVTNNAEDVFSPYRFLNNTIFGNSFYTWRTRYFDSYGYGNYQYRLKKSTEQEFLEKVHSIAYRATKESCLDLPPITHVSRMVDLEPSALKVYHDLVKDSIAQLGKGEITTPNVLTRLLRLSQLTGGFIGGDDDPKPQAVSKAKLDALADLIDTAQQEGQKIVIIARFIAEIAAIKKLLESSGIQYSAISGETKDRAEQVRQFQENPDITVFVGQIATAGMGITLTAASTMIFYSLSYSSSDFEQAKARIHRSGQTQPCTYYYLLARKTVDEKILKCLHDKTDLARTLIDDFRNGVNPF